MKTTLVLIGFVMMIAGVAPLAHAADNRFDGIWVGTETVMGYEYHGTLKSSEMISRKIAAKIVIAQGGALVGVLEGYGTGRYDDVKRVGNKIVFHAGVRTGELSLSPDGQTLMEKGRVPAFFTMGTDGRGGALNGHVPVIQANKYLQSDKSTADMTGTFRREK